MAAPRGNLLVAQSGGPTAVINNSLYGVIKEGTKSKEITGILGALHGIEGILEENIVDLNQEDEQTLKELKNTPASALGSIRREVTEEDYDRILEVFNKYNICYFFYIGGNDSMDTADKVNQLSRETGREIRVLGIPKTVDNDLVLTDHCPGYGSAARYTAVSVREVGLDVESLPIPVSVFETMGRNSGWLVASSALASDENHTAPNLIYFPEIPFNQQKFLEDVQEVYDELGYVLVAVSEGLRDETGNPVAMDTSTAKRDGFGHPLPGGVGSRLADLISSKLGLRARDEKPGLCARSSAILASEVDRKEARELGTAAVKAALKGKTGKMVALKRSSSREYNCQVQLVPLNKVAKKEKKLPDKFINEEENYVTEAFIKYARPLIGDPLPEYAKLRKIKADPKEF